MKFNQEYFNEILSQHPELLAFLCPDVEATSDYNTSDLAPWMHELYDQVTYQLKPEESASIDTEDDTPLVKLIESANADARSIELERTMLCIMCMDAVYSGDRTFFEKSPVPFGKPLSKDQFNQLYLSLIQHFPKDTGRKILFCELVLGDIGKIKPLRELLCQEFSIHEQDPDRFIEALLAQDHARLSEILPTIASLTKKEFEELRKTYTGFHYGHFCHTESTERELGRLQNILKQRGMRYLTKNMLVQLFDVAGARAHDQGKIQLNNVIFGTYFDDMLPALKQLEYHTPEEVYRDYLVKRLDIAQVTLEDSTKQSLSTTERLLGRLLCMFRIYKPGDAATLQASLARLEEDDQFKRDLATLDSYQANPKFHTPTYMPALLNALKDNKNLATLAHGEDEDAQTTALRVGMRLIAMSLAEHQKRHSENQNPVNFNQLTSVVKGDLNDIKSLLKQHNIAIDSAGNAMVGQSKTAANSSSSWLATISKVAIVSALGVAAFFAIRKIMESNEADNGSDLSIRR